MIYVGIDIAKETHVAAAMSTDGVVLLEPFAFQNDHEGFKLLKSKLDTLNGNILIGLESTAHYAENVIFFLHSQQFKLAVINPVQTAAMRKTGIRKTKTDKVDSLLIAFIWGSPQLHKKSGIVFYYRIRLCLAASSDKKVQRN